MAWLFLIEMLLARYTNWNRPCSALWRRLRLQRVKMRNDAINMEVNEGLLAFLTRKRSALLNRPLSCGNPHGIKKVSRQMWHTLSPSFSNWQKRCALIIPFVGPSGICARDHRQRHQVLASRSTYSGGDATSPGLWLIRCELLDLCQ